MMASDSGLQLIIGTALVDEKVMKALMHNPLSLADRFGLTLAERRFLVRAQPRDLEHFAAMVEGWTPGQPPSRRAEDIRYTHARRVG